MSLPHQSSRLATSLATSKPVAEPSARFLPCADVVFTQDETGMYLSFYCSDSETYGLKPEHVIAQGSESDFLPVSVETYMGRIRYVLNTQVAQRFTYPFSCCDILLLLDLAVSPILVTEGHATQVIVVGNLLREISPQEATNFVNELPPLQPSILLNRYQELLTQVAWNIRRTLDLETIWQQTVDGLGEALGADRCLIYPYKPGDRSIKGVAEYARNPNTGTLLSHVLEVNKHPYLEQAIRTARPVIFNSEEGTSSKTVLALTTCYQDDPNALIIICQPEQFLILNEREVDLIQEFADQVGTGIAHASLFAESRDLAIELQQANDRLIQKHHELEEAHKQAEEASRLKSEFLANTSHELRTPLNAMIGFLKLVLDGMADDPEERDEFIGEAHRSAVHLLNIINDILDIARIEAGKMQLEMNPVNLEGLLTDVENFTRTQAEQKNLIYEIRLPATHDSVLLYGNYQRLLQVLLNLIWNAIKFTVHGSIVITAEIEEREKAGDESNTGMVKLSVADTGIGVSLEDQDKLFQSFSQVDGSRTRRFGGSGLGLVISQKLVEAMGGVVNFFSMGEGLGSTVTFTVPLYQDPVIIDPFLD